MPSEPEPAVLPPLAYEPGAHAAVVLLRPRSVSSVASVLNTIRALTLPRSTWMLVATDPQIARDHLGHEGLAVPRILPLTRGAHRFPTTQAGLVLQLGSASRDDLVAALRALDAALSPFCWRDEEVLGGWGAERREPFGFRELGRYTPEAGRTATVPQGVGRGGSWILYLRFETDRMRFLAHRESERKAIMGVEEDGAPLPNASPDAHRSVVHPYARALLRRGFPYRVSGRDGLAFVAAAADPAVHAGALRAMLDTAGGDRLLDYATAVSGGLYFASPRFTSEPHP